MSHDLVSDSLVIIKNAEKVGKGGCTVPRSKLVENILDVMKRYGYVAGYTNKKRTIVVELLGKINKSASIRPRLSVSYNDFESFEKVYLPAKNVGIMIVTTSEGVMSHLEARDKKLGGKLLAYVY